MTSPGGTPATPSASDVAAAAPAPQDAEESDADGGSAISEESWQQAVAAIAAAERPLLVCHINPDGDALGSMLACALALRQLGRPAQATFPGPQELPETFGCLPGLELLTPPEQTEPEPDLMITFDAASAGRLGEFEERMASAKHVVVLDHHASNPGFGTVNLVEPGAAATGVVVHELLRRLGARLDRDIAACLYVAIATDTGSFKYQATTPEVHQLAAELLRTGVNHYEISRQLFDARPFGALRIFAEALHRLRLEPQAAGGAGFVWTYATLDDLATHAQPAYVLESLIDVVRSAEEADVACVAKQVAEDEWAVSLRSRGAVDVARVASALGGGGHRYAAGFTGQGELSSVVDSLRATLSDHVIAG